MTINILGNDLILNTKGNFQLAINYLMTRGKINLEKGKEEVAKRYLDKAFEVEGEYKKFLVKK